MTTEVNTHVVIRRGVFSYMTDSKGNKTDRVQVPIDGATRDLLDKLPKGVEVAPVLRVFLLAWLDEILCLDSNGVIRLGEESRATQPDPLEGKAREIHAWLVAATANSDDPYVDAMLKSMRIWLATDPSKKSV